MSATTSSTVRKFATIAAAGVLGVMLGLFARKSFGLGASASSLRSAAVSEEAGGAKTPVLSAIATQAAAAEAAEERRLREALALEPRPQRLLWFATRAEGASPDELAQLLRLAGDDGVLREMLVTRWAQVDPQHLFDTLSVEWRKLGRHDSSVMRILAQEWSKRDPQALIAALDDEQAFPGIEGVRKSTADILMRQDPDAGLGVLERWSIRRFIPRMDKLTEWAKQDPRGAADRVAAIDADFAGSRALGAVGKAWAEIDPEAALDYAAGLKSVKQKAFAQEAMAVWAKHDLEAAITFASAQEDVGFRGVISGGLLAEWGKQDPAAALQWGQENLQSQMRAEAIGQLVGSLAKQDAQAAADLVFGMDGGGAQFIAAQKVVEAWVEATDGKSIPQAVAWLATLPDHAMAQRVLEGAAWRIAFEDPRALVNIVEGEYGHLIGSQAIYKAGQTQVRENPLAAIEWAQGLPADRAQRVEQSVVRTWISLQPAAANDWAVALPAGEQRDSAVDSIAQSFLTRPADQLRPWLERLSEDEQPRVREIVSGLRASDDQKAKLAAALAE